MRQGILLTGADSQTIVEVPGNTKMRFPGTTNRRDSASLGRVFACILLVGLFLYNPFLAAGRASGNLMVCHPASHRGTVGSSELEQFAQPNDGVRDQVPQAQAKSLPRFPVNGNLTPSPKNPDSSVRVRADSS